MVSIIELLLRDPIRGLIVILFILFFYLWREQGKIKTEIASVERFLDKKKLDKEDFGIYQSGHSKEHKDIKEYLKLAIELLKERLK